MENIQFIDLFKFRTSIGKTGADNVGGGRWAYLTEWQRGGNAVMGVINEGAEASPYAWFRETRVGNPNVQWEEALKYNVGVDFELFKGLISGKADLFGIIVPIYITTGRCACHTKLFWNRCSCR
ncbi:hypothetical protein [Niabella hibiscisoli]|uniref:hypothetical protein n=1 Tax=Niabella hibiscisoli TaxID=1825928 RepID=UPI00374C9FA3